MELLERRAGKLVWNQHKNIISILRAPTNVHTDGRDDEIPWKINEF
nr:MAG TPA: hypothetical protein [Caudoviricetes sp.]